MVLNLDKDEGQKWFFPPLNGGEFQGLSDRNVDNFKTTDNLGRESAQNCIGAIRDECKTVAMKYSLKEIDSNLFPGRYDYLKRLESAKKFFSRSENFTGDEIAKLDKAINTIKKDKIPVLIISDFNTTGLYGNENYEFAPYFKFFKSSGISTYTDDSPGTYGHGKNALINFSDLRAITVYSKHIEDIDGTNDLYVGRSNFCSHQDPLTEELTQRVGYYAITDEMNKAWKAFRGVNIDHSLLPIKREGYGTDIYVWGFNDLDNLKFWDIKLAMGLMYAFFNAVKRKKIEFEILWEDNIIYKINHENLASFQKTLENDCINKLGSEFWEKSEARLVSGYLNCVDENKLIKNHSFNVKDIGSVNLKIYTDKDNKSLKNTYCIMRKPLMTIQSFSRGESGIPYQAICEILEDEGNKTLARMEDVTHTELHQSHVKGSLIEIQSFKNTLIRLKKAIHKRIDELTPKIKDSADIPGLSELLFGDPLSDTEGNSVGRENNEVKSKEVIETLDMIIDPKIKESTPAYKTRRNPNDIVINKKPSTKGTKGGNEGNHGGDGNSNKGKGHGAGDGKGNASESQEGENISLIPAELIQIFRTRSKYDKEVSKFKIKALKKIEGKLRLGCALDQNGNNFIPINDFDLINTDKPIKNNNALVFENLKLYKNDSFEFEIKFSSEFDFAVGAY